MEVEPKDPLHERHDGPREFQHDHDAIQRLLPDVQAAADLRSGLRYQIGMHEREAHTADHADYGEELNDGTVEV